MAKRVAEAIDRLSLGPYLCILLRGSLKGCYKYRVGSYRIIYEIHQRILTIIVIDIGHRKENYR